jgi:uncharacterized protein (TIGR02646 family)
MKRLVRRALPPAAVNYLQRKQVQVDAGQEVHKTWKNAQRTQKMATVAAVLREMTGAHDRCMFCGDSRGTDTEHFWPKTRYADRAFRWENLLRICGGCNRQKGDQFPLRGRLPLLIDPTVEDPWDFLVFEPVTGIIAARIDGASGEPHPKGVTTLQERLLPLNIEAIKLKRQATQRNLERAVARFLGDMVRGAALPQARAELHQAVQDNDAHGLAQWYFRRDGSNEPPFRELRANYPEIWQSIQAVI